MASPVAPKITVVDHPLVSKLLTPQCLEFLTLLHKTHNATRKQLLEERVKLAVLFDKGLPMVFFYFEFNQVLTSFPQNRPILLRLTL